MDIANVYSPETFSLSDFFTANGMPARCSGKIMEIKMGIESKKAIRDFRVQTSDKTGYGFDFSLIHIAWD